MYKNLTKRWFFELGTIFREIRDKNYHVSHVMNSVLDSLQFVATLFKMYTKISKSWTSYEIILCWKLL